MRKISDMLYHEGIVLKIYPSFQQQKIVAVNIPCSVIQWPRR